MRKSKIYSLLIWAALAFSYLTVKAQQPIPIDIKSLTLSFQRGSTEGQFSMRAMNTSQNEVIYAGQGSYSLALFNCIPCNLPNSFNSNGFQRDSGFQFQWGFDKLVYFYVSEVKSDVIFLRPMIRRKPRLFSLSGTTQIHGRVEIRDNTNTIIAVDNEVKLEGGYTVNFLNNNFLDGRKVEFSQISYSLNQQVN